MSRFSGGRFGEWVWSLAREGVDGSVDRLTHRMPELSSCS